MAQALFISLQKQHKGLLIDVLALPQLHPLLARMPEINRCIDLDFAHGTLNLWKRYLLGRKLRKDKYDQVIILPNSFKSALIPFWAKIPLRTGWRGEMRYGLLNDLRILNKKKYPQMVMRFCALGLQADLRQKQCPWPKLQANQENALNILKNFGLEKLINTSKPILALCPGAEYGSSKRWPTEHFATVAKTKSEEGWEIIILGGPKDKELAQYIQTQSGNVCIDFTGKTDLGSVVDLLALAKAVISNDSGLMHVAAALNLPMIAIYGSSSSEFTPPLSKNAQIISLNLPCSPCFQRVCPFGHTRCLQDLTPEIVINKLKFLNL